MRSWTWTCSHPHICVCTTHTIALRTNLLRALWIPCGGGAHHPVRTDGWAVTSHSTVAVSVQSRGVSSWEMKQNLIQCSELNSSTDQTFWVFPLFSPLALLRVLHSFLSLVKWPASLTFTLTGWGREDSGSGSAAWALSRSWRRQDAVFPPSNLECPSSSWVF